MIIVDGKTNRAEVQTEVRTETALPDGLIGLLGDKLDGFLSSKMAELIKEIRKARGSTESASGDLYLEDEESLKHIADLMAAKKDVESTNIVNIGSKRVIKADNEEKNKTIDLLSSLG